MVISGNDIFLFSSFLKYNSPKEKKDLNTSIISKKMWILWRDQKVTLPGRVSHVSAALWFNAICCTHLPLCWQGVIIDFLWSLWKEVLLPWWWLQRGGDPILIPMQTPHFYIFARATGTVEPARNTLLVYCLAADSQCLHSPSHNHTGEEHDRRAQPRKGIGSWWTERLGTWLLTEDSYKNMRVMRNTSLGLKWKHR